MLNTGSMICTSQIVAAPRTLPLTATPDQIVSTFSGRGNPKMGSGNEPNANAIYIYIYPSRVSMPMSESASTNTLSNSIMLRPFNPSAFTSSSTSFCLDSYSSTAASSSPRIICFFCRMDLIFFKAQSLLRGPNIPRHCLQHVSCAL
ncbi:unnamed protein product [Prorocentrum cordatum]|uniref:Uncharacterized protein n=1 Tax=Prorocentrum cordatum TaxID=2364126 RepID=A0ABN9SH29_9DINO|nr:unnamed protein product [Polarella glacialis]